MSVRNLEALFRPASAALVGQCLPENAGMAVLARHAGFDVESGEDTVAMRLVLRDGL